MLGPESHHISTINLFPPYLCTKSKMQPDSAIFCFFPNSFLFVVYICVMSECVCVIFLIGHTLLNISVKLIWSSKKQNKNHHAKCWAKKNSSIHTIRARERERERESFSSRKKLRLTTFAHKHVQTVVFLFGASSFSFSVFIFFANLFV